MARDLAVLDDPAVAIAALDPIRARILGALGEDGASAAAVAGRLGIPRQKVNYHLRLLEQRGLVAEVGERRHGGIVERVLAPTARAFVVSTAALGTVGATPEAVRDRLSASYAIALGARVVHEVGRLLDGAQRARRRLPVLSVDVDVRLRTAADRTAFADDLAVAVAEIAARYHDEEDEGGRWYRLLVVAHPRPPEAPQP